MTSPLPIEKLSRCIESSPASELIPHLENLQVLNDEDLFSMFVQNIQDIYQLFDESGLPEYWLTCWRLVEAVSESALVDFAFQKFDYTFVSKKAHSFKESHWLYVALCYPVPVRKHDGRTPRIFFRLSQLSCLMEFMSLTLNSPQDELSDRAFYNSCKFLRHLNVESLMNLALHIEDIIDSTFCSQINGKFDVWELLEIVKAVLNSTVQHEQPLPQVGKSQQYKVDALTRMFALSLREKDARRKRRSWESAFISSAPKREQFRDAFVELDSTVFSDVSGNPELGEFQYKDAGAPGDLKSARTVITRNSVPRGDEGFTDIRQVVYKHRGMLNAIHKRNQRLVYDVRNLTQNDIAKLDQTFSSWLKKSQQNIDGVILDVIDAWLSIWLILATGKDCQQVCAELLMPSGSGTELKLSQHDIVVGYQTDFQRVNANLVERLTAVLIQQNQKLTLQVGDYFYQRLKNVLIIKKLKQQSLNLGVSFRVKNAQVAEHQIKSIFSYVNQKHNAALSVGKITQWLAQQIRFATGDDEALVFLLLNQQAAQQPAQAHYSNYHHQIASLYQHITSSNWVEKREPWVYRVNSEQIHRNEGLGSEFVVQFSNVMHLAEALSKRAEVAPMRTFREVCEKHNKMVDYIYWMLEFSIGLRSVNDPLASLTDIDWHTGILQLNDKAMRAACSVRYVALPDIALRQLLRYREHLQKLLHIQLVHKSLYGEQLDKLLRGEAVTFGFLFYLNDKGLPERFKPAKLRYRMTGIFPAPLNSGRHWLRSRLIEKRCPVAFIDALLGHGELGAEFASRFSSMSFQQLFALKEGYLEPLMAESGWCVVNGLLKNGI